MQDHRPSSKNTTGSGEIDLQELLAAVGRFFNRLGNSIVLFILSVRRATRKFIWLLTLFMIIGAGLGLISYNSFEPYFSSQLVLNSRYYSAEMMEHAIEELHQLADEKNYAVLARKLNITPEQAASIRSFSTLPVTTSEEVIEVEALLQAIEQSGSKLTPEQMEALRERLTMVFYNHEILVTIYDISILDALEHGLYQYLQDNDFVRRRVAVEQENLRILLDKLRQDQEQLNHLKKLQAEAYRRMAETGQTGSNNVIFGTPETTNAPLNVYVQDLDFARELLKTNRKLELNRALEIVSGFTPYGEPASLSLLGQLVTGALIGAAVAYTIIILLAINQALNRYEAKHLHKNVHA